MENNTFPANPSGTFVHAPVATDLRSFLSNVFTYMAVALVLRGVVAFWFASDEALVDMLRDRSPENRPSSAGWCSSPHWAWCC